MQKTNQIGVVIDELTASQLAFDIINNFNEELDNTKDDYVVFFENSTSSIVNPKFSTMAINELWSFHGVLIATSVSSTLSMIKAFSPAKKIFYVWDLEWTRRHGKSFEDNIKAFTNEEVLLVARSKRHAKAIENYCNKKVDHIVQNFNIKNFKRIIENEQRVHKQA